MIIFPIFACLFLLGNGQDFDELLGQFRSENAPPNNDIVNDYDPVNGAPPTDFSTSQFTDAPKPPPTTTVNSRRRTLIQQQRQIDQVCSHSITDCSSLSIDRLHRQLSPAAQTTLPSNSGNLQFCRTREGSSLNSWNAIRKRVLDKQPYNDQESKQQSYCLQQLWTEQGNCVRLKNYLCASRSKKQCLDAINDLRVRTDRDECGEIKAGGQEVILQKAGVIATSNPFDAIEQVTYSPVDKQKDEIESDPFNRIKRPRDVPSTVVEQLVSGLRETGPLLSHWQPTSINSRERTEQAVNAATDRQTKNLRDSFAKFELPTSGSIANGIGRNVGIPGLGPIGTGKGTIVAVYPANKDIQPSHLFEVIDGPRPYFHDDLNESPLTLASALLGR